MALQIAKNLVVICSQFEEHKIKREDSKSEEEQEESNEPTDNSALQWLISRLALILRTERRAFDLYESKNSIIQILASAMQSFSVERVTELSTSIIYGLFPFTEGLITSAGDVSSDPKAKNSIP